jgi:hypothetical protein
VRSDRSATQKKDNPAVKRLSVSAGSRAEQPFQYAEVVLGVSNGWPGIGLLLLRISVAAACLLAHIQCETHAVWVLPTVIPMSACLCAGALALLGPGAYSLDALRFARRVILAESWRDGDSE